MRGAAERAARATFRPMNASSCATVARESRRRSRTRPRPSSLRARISRPVFSTEGEDGGSRSQGQSVAQNQMISASIP